MSQPNGYCPRCGIATHAIAPGRPQPCRDCRSVDKKFTSQWPSLKEQKKARTQG